MNKIRQIAQLFSFKDLRNASLGLLVILGGLGLAFLTLYAHRTGNAKLAGTAATASLVFVFLIIIFVIPPLARNASAEASQLNLPFEFTTGGAIFIGLLVIVGFAAWNTGNNLLFLVLAFITSALIISFLIGNFCLKKLDVKMRFPETIFAGEATPILVSLHNRKRFFPTFSVTAEVRGKEREFSKLLQEFKRIVSEKWAKKIARAPIIKHTLDYFVFIPRKNSIENQVEHIFQQRGKFTIKDFELSTKFPFAFFRHRRRLPAQKTEIIVFPKLKPLETEIFDLPLETGKLISARRGAGDDLFALRDYQPTDDFRHIDWKATARSNHLTVREFSAEDDKRITIVLDTRIKQDEAEKTKSLRQKIREEQEKERLSSTEIRFEKGVSQTASLLAHFAEENAEIRLIIDDKKQDFNVGKKHLNKLLKQLALIEPNYSESFSDKTFDDFYGEVFDEQNNSHFFFVSSLNKGEVPAKISRRATLVNY